MCNKNRRYQELIELFRAGHEEAIKPIIDDLCEALYRSVRLRVDDSSTAQDIVQEAFIRLFCEVRRGTQFKSVKNWLYRVSHSLVADYFRELQRSREVVVTKGTAKIHARGSETVEDPPGAIEFDPESSITSSELLEVLRDCLYKFQPEVRGVLVAYMHGFNLRQIAETFGLEIQRVNNIWTRNRKKLWNCMKQKLPELDKQNETIE